MASLADFSDSDDEAPQLISVTAPQGDLEVKRDPVPVTILTGFLGAGKTTLLNRMLRSGRRIAVVENEFGAGLDIESLIARDGLDNANDDDDQMTRLVELSNGCICCSVKDSLVAALESLVARQPSDKPLEHIIVETSGLAHPGPVASLFWVDAELESSVKLDGIVTVVDAYHLPKNLNLSGDWNGFSALKTEKPGNIGEIESTIQDQDATCAAQIAYADRILLNKSDLVNDLKPLIDTISLLNPLALIQATTQAEVKSSWILDIHAYDDDEIENITTSSSSLKKTTTPWQLSSSNSIDILNAKHVHDLTVSSINVVIENAVINRNKLNQWLALLLWENNDPINSENTSTMNESNNTNTTVTSTSSASSVPFGFLEMEIFRMKGSFAIFNESSTDCLEDKKREINEFKHVLQVVHGLFDITETKEKWQVSSQFSSSSTSSGNSSSILNDDEVNEIMSVKMVFIGKHLNKRKLENGLRGCVEML